MTLRLCHQAYGIILKFGYQLLLNLDMSQTLKQTSYTTISKTIEGIDIEALFIHVPASSQVLVSFPQVRVLCDY